MNETALRERDILKIQDKLYRILYISDPIIVLCQMNTSKLEIGEYDIHAIRTSIANGKIIVIEDNDNSVVDIDKLSDAELKRFESRQKIIDEVNIAYAPKYVELSNTKSKETVKRIISDYNLSRSYFWRLCRNYLQSGMKESSLLRKKRSVQPQDTPTGKKRGSKGTTGIAAGCALSEQIIEAFEYGLAFYKSGRAKSYDAAYSHMNNKYFFHDVVIDGIKQSRLLPIDERPTYRQFYYYCSKRMSKEDFDALKTSRMEQRNDKRLLLSEATIYVEAPGEKVEADSLEVDVSLISIISGATNQSIGRPIVYAMRDALTHAVVAISVGFDNNSFLGLTNLFLNLGDDKKEYCAKYGIFLDDERLFPSCFLPMELYVDRGSDYKSDPAQKLCNALGITRHLVPGGSGSFKGVIEQWFHQIHAMVNPYTEGAGQIQKRHDSKHHRQAVLNVYDFTQMLITCVISYNQTHMDNYKPRLCEINDGIDATPSILWEYYCKTKGAPRPILNKFDYFYKLLLPHQAKIDKFGIHFCNLSYINYDDDDLLDMMYSTQKKKRHFDIKYDPRDNSRVYYTDNAGNFVYASLNEGLSWQADLKGLTIKETKDYFKFISIKNKEALQRNEEIKATRAGIIDGIVSSAEASHPTYAETKNMREAREIEKQEHNRQNSITERLDSEENKTNSVSKAPENGLIVEHDTQKQSENPPVLSDDEYYDKVSHFYEYDDTEE